MATAYEVIAELGRAFPRQPITRGTLDAYVRELADLDPDTLEQVVRVLARTSEFFPTIRAIREAAAEHDLHLPGENEALAQVEARITWGRQAEHERGDAPAIHRDVRAALDLVGGWAAWRSADNPAVIRGQFLRLYRETRAVRVREHMVGGISLPAAPHRPALTA